MSLQKAGQLALGRTGALIATAGRSASRALRGGSRSYTVRAGDTLSKVALVLLGKASRWREIATVNGIDDPRKLRIGQVLTLPGAASVRPPSPPAGPKILRRPTPSGRTAWPKPEPGAAAHADLGASDPISLTGRFGLDRTMAAIYNAKGRYLCEAARALGVDSACAAAVLKVESGGSGFARDGRMIIRFENHVFFDRWGRKHRETYDDHFRFDAGKRWLGHHYRTGAGERWSRCHTGQSREWDVLELARGLHDELALQSISMGAAQVMGFNHDALGYRSARRMFDRLSASVRAQLDGMFDFIAGEKVCVAGLRARDYEMFANGYNGSGQAAAYGARLRQAAAAYGRVTRGRRFA